MTNLTNALATRISNEDEIHFVHARNRVLLAIRIVEAAEQMQPNGLRTPAQVIQSAMKGAPMTVARLTALAAPASGTLSESTLALALEIASA